MKEVKIKVPEPKDFVSEKALLHFMNAYREFLLGIKELVDFAIEKAIEIEKKGEVKKIEIE